MAVDHWALFNTATSRFNSSLPHTPPWGDISKTGKAKEKQKNLNLDFYPTFTSSGFQAACLLKKKVTLKRSLGQGLAAPLQQGDVSQCSAMGSSFTPSAAPSSAPGLGSPEVQLCHACSESSPGPLSPLQCLSFSPVTAGGAQPCCLTAATCPVTYTYCGMPEVWDNRAPPHRRDPLLRAGNGIYQLSQGQRSLGWKELQKRQMNQEGKSLLLYLFQYSSLHFEYPAQE